MDLPGLRLAKRLPLRRRTTRHHHQPKAKRVIQLFMNGGVSQMDTFDHKPVLNKLNGKKFDPGDGRLVESVTNSPGFKVLKARLHFGSTASAALGE